MLKKKKKKKKKKNKKPRFEHVVYEIHVHVFHCKKP